MNKGRRDPEALLPLTPAVFHILLALADRERHGYGIMQEIAARTDGTMRMGPGTLYGSIKRMLADGLIEAAVERPDPELDDETPSLLQIDGFWPARVASRGIAIRTSCANRAGEERTAES